MWGQTGPRIKSVPHLWVNFHYLLMVDLVVDGEIEQLVISQVEHIEHMMALLELLFQQYDGVSSSKLLSPSKPKWLSLMPRKTEFLNFWDDFEILKWNCRIENFGSNFGSNFGWKFSIENLGLKILHLKTKIENFGWKIQGRKMRMENPGSKNADGKSRV